MNVQAQNVSFIHAAMGDLFAVSTYLTILDRAQVEQLGLALGLTQPTLNKMGTQTFLEDMLGWWLQGMDHVTDAVFGGHTWKSLCNGLRKGTVRQGAIAAQIEKDMGL